jgi:hypothetical protein
MRKDDAIALSARMATAGTTAATKAGYSLSDDGRLSHDEVAGVARWALRMAPDSGWPHRADMPGLRFEAWFFAGKPKPDEEVLLMLVLAGADLPQGLTAAMVPAFNDLVTNGKYAKRYRPIEPMAADFYPGALGIVKRMPIAITKLVPAWEQLVADAYKPVQGALRAWDPDGTLATRVASAIAPNPFEALGRKFSP